MKTLGIVGGILLLLALLIGWGLVILSPSSPVGNPNYLLEDDSATLIDTDGPPEDFPRVSVVAENLEIPWEVLFLPDGEILVTERPGTLLLLRDGAEITVPGVRHIGEGGLLGAELDPNFASNNLIYLYQTTESAEGLTNRVVRYRLENGELTMDKVIIENLPGARNHDGGRISFGPDGHLYITLGDAGNEASAQDTNNLAGSILRVTKDGEIPEDNPFNNEIYSYGHRNPQGLAWDSAGQLWSSEHGRSGALSGYDELNLVTKGSNYGWPTSQGDAIKAGTIGPIKHSGGSSTWAPGGLAYLDDYLYIPGLRGETLYRIKIGGEEVGEWEEFLVGEYGRLRTITVGPDKMLYLTTSNRDGRTPDVEVADDRLIRINPAKL